MRTTALLDKLRSPDVGASDEQLSFVSEAIAVYRDLHVIVGDRALPLHSACHCHVDCWAGVKDRPPRERAGVPVPWVGPGYSKHRVCVVAINHNRYGGLGANW